VDSVFVVFETVYESHKHYGDEQGRIHDTYRTDNSGTPLYVYEEREKAFEKAQELERYYREDCPRKRNPFRMHYHDLDDETESPPISERQLAELSSLGRSEFLTAECLAAFGFDTYSLAGKTPRQKAARERLPACYYRRDWEEEQAIELFNNIDSAKLDPLCGSKWLKFSPEQLKNASFVYEQLHLDCKEQPEETKMLDDLARDLWRLMDRVVLFKVVRMNLDDVTAINP